MGGVFGGEVAGEVGHGAVLLAAGSDLCQRADAAGEEFAGVNLFEFGLDKVVAGFVTTCRCLGDAAQQVTVGLQGVMALVGGEVGDGVVVGVGVGLEQGDAGFDVALAQVIIGARQVVSEGFLRVGIVGSGSVSGGFFCRFHRPIVCCRSGIRLVFCVCGGYWCRHR